MKYPVSSCLGLLALAAGLASQGSAPAPVAGALLELRLLASDGYEVGGVSFDLAIEKKRLRSWLDGSSNGDRVVKDPWFVDRFNALSPDAGGSMSSHVRWYPHVIRSIGGSTKRWEFAYASAAESSALALFTSEEYATGPTQDTKRLVELLPVNMHDRGFTGLDLDNSSFRSGTDPGSGRPSVFYRAPVPCES